MKERDEGALLQTCANLSLHITEGMKGIDNLSINTQTQDYKKYSRRFKNFYNNNMTPTMT